MERIKNAVKAHILSNLKIKHILLGLAAFAVIVAGFLFMSRNRRDFREITSAVRRLLILLDMVLLSFHAAQKKECLRMPYLFGVTVITVAVITVAEPLRVVENVFASCFDKAIFDVIIPSVGFCIACAGTLGNPKREKIIRASVCSLLTAAVYGVLSLFLPTEDGIKLFICSGIIPPVFAGISMLCWYAVFVLNEPSVKPKSASRNAFNGNFSEIFNSSICILLLSVLCVAQIFVKHENIVHSCSLLSLSFYFMIPVVMYFAIVGKTKSSGKLWLFMIVFGIWTVLCWWFEANVILPALKGRISVLIMSAESVFEDSIGCTVACLISFKKDIFRKPKVPELKKVIWITLGVLADMIFVKSMSGVVGRIAGETIINIMMFYVFCIYESMITVIVSAIWLHVFLKKPDAKTSLTRRERRMNRGAHI